MDGRVPNTNGFANGFKESRLDDMLLEGTWLGSMRVVDAIEAH